MNLIYGKVTTSIVNADNSYTINVFSNISDIEYRDCDLLNAFGVTSMPKVNDVVLLAIVSNNDFIILGKVVDKITKELIISGENIKILGETITANNTNLITDNT